MKKESLTLLSNLPQPFLDSLQKANESVLSYLKWVLGFFLSAWVYLFANCDRKDCIVQMALITIGVVIAIVLFYSFYKIHTNPKQVMKTAQIAFLEDCFMGDDGSPKEYQSGELSENVESRKKLKQ